MTSAAERAWAAHELGRWPDAERLAGEALEGQPDDGRLLALVADAVGRQHRLDEAVELADQALALTPDDPWVLDVAAVACLRTKRTQQAQDLADELLKLEPADARSHLLRAFVLRQQAGRFRNLFALRRLRREWTAAAERAIELNPTSPDPHVFLAGVEVRGNRGRKALPHLEEALRLDPQDVDALVLLGMVKGQVADVRAGSEHLVAAAKLDPSSAHAVRTLRFMSLRWILLLGLLWFYVAIILSSAASRASDRGVVALLVGFVAFVLASLAVAWRFRHRFLPGREARAALRASRRYRR